MSASSATRELDELMASLSDFKVQSNVSRVYCPCCRESRFALLPRTRDDVPSLRNPAVNFYHLKRFIHWL